MTSGLGRRILRHSVDHDYEIIGPDAPTHHGPNSQDVLDITIYRGLNTPPRQTVFPDLPSDHRPVLLEFSEPPTRVNFPASRQMVNWAAFVEELESNTPTRKMSTREDVERMTGDITHSIRSALETSTRTVPKGGRQRPLHRRIQDLIKEKRALRTEWQNTRCPSMKTRLNLLVERVKAALDENAAESWDEYLDSIRGDMPSVHRLCRKLSTLPEPVRPLIGEDGQPRFKAEDRAEIFASYLETQFVPNIVSHLQHDTEVIQHLERLLAARRAGSTEGNTLFFTPRMVARVIGKLKPKKAPGPDKITNMVLRHLPSRTVAAVTRLYNGILRTGHFPDEWKLGLVIMIPKPGKDQKRPEGYRPITLLSTLSKVFEQLILAEMRPHVSLIAEQFGFREEHSTVLQLTRFIHKITTSYNKKEYFAAVLLDMEKAFDRVWHEGLLYKVSTSTTTPLQIIHVLQSFLENRRVQVLIEGKTSREVPVRAGVPQGSCLSPILYAVYTNDIPLAGKAELALFADDTAYFASSMNRNRAAKLLQPTLDALPDWLAKWRLAVNVKKTQAFISRVQTKLPEKLTLQGQTLPWKSTVKYLGVTIDRKLTFKSHADNVVARVKTARRMLRPVFSSKLPLRTKVGIYKTYIRSRLTYAAPAWFACLSESQKKRLRAQQSQTLRTIVAAPRYVRNATISRDLRVESLDDFVSSLATRMFHRADISAHVHLQNIAPLHARPPDEGGDRGERPSQHRPRSRWIKMKPQARVLVRSRSALP